MYTNYCHNTVIVWEHTAVFVIAYFCLRAIVFCFVFNVMRTLQSLTKVFCSFDSLYLALGARYF